ncbi:YqiA/YcfP family alpha/beta fold hydrolase [Nitratifractor sp.]
MILYIHGFASSGLGEKARKVREYFGEAVFAPSLSYVPELAVDTLEQIALHCRKRHEPLHLIGSSLGGFYALYLAARHNLQAVLVNPSLRPWETLAARTTQAVNYYDLTRFEWSPRHVESLRRFRVEPFPHPEKVLLMLQTGDEVLDYRLARDALPGARLILEEGGSHAFEGFERHLGTIRDFFAS